MSQLTQHQIDHLFIFTSKKMVHWYDLQCEIVDHLAEDIEQLMDKDTTISFESALDKVYSKFGLFGFSNVVKEKENAMRKAANKRIWIGIKQQFQWPQFIRTFCIFVFCYMSALYTTGLQFSYIIVAGLAISMFISVYTSIKNNRRKKRLLMLQNPYSYVSYIAWHIQLNMMFRFWSDDYSVQSVEFPFANALFTSITFFIFISWYNINKQLHTDAKEFYPQVFV